VSVRLLVLEAGEAAANNLVRSLKAGDPSLEVIGCNQSRFFLKKSTAGRNYALPLSPQAYGTALRRIIKTERIDLVLPTSDSHVFRLSELGDKLRGKTFLPPRSVIERCQDKYALSVLLRRHGIPVPLTYPITNSAHVGRLFQRFKPRSRLWCRIRRGSGSNGAIPVKTPEQVQSWIAYWEQMRAVPPGSFTLSEYLPGRDYCVQCLWDKGRLVLAKMAERITYLNNGSPSGVSSMPALAKTVFDPHVIELCKKAIRALDAKASGVFFVDLKENENREPCITEINAGRFATMTNIHDLTGKHNMAVMFVRLARGERISIPDASDFAEGYFLVRSVDTLPAIVRKDELYQDIQDTGAGP
jgi:glutathione synthase/RimK-type ligase-like ATP-grasp enzyme